MTKRVTSEDVAKRAGVSRTTVSLVLNEVPGVNIRTETRQRVLEAARELGYVPDAAAQALASRKSKIIALILTRDPHLLSSDAFLNQIIDSLVTNLRKNNMHLILEIVEESHTPETYLELVQSNRIDGIIFSGPRFDDQALQMLAAEEFPTVIIGQLPGMDVYCVDVDNRKAARMAVNHLIKLGHRRIACITNADLSFTAAADRLAGYRDALTEAGIPYREEYVRFGDFDLESGYQQMKSLLTEDPHPTAVFVASDVVAFGAMTAVREHGLQIPHDVALVGFDDVPMARYVDPYLTTVQLPTSDLGKTACELLIKIINHQPPQEKRLLLETHLVVRDSCGENYQRLQID